MLCPATQDPLDQVLPALTSSANVDLELYALLAVIFRDFVQKWYGQITSDTAFVDEVVTVVAHVTRALEERLRKVSPTFPLLFGGANCRLTWKLLFWMKYPQLSGII